MTRFSSIASLGLAILGLAACGAPPHPPAPAAKPAAPNDSLNRLVDQYWDEHLPSGNALSAQFLADSLAVERRFLTEVLAVPRAVLDAQGGLTYDIFKRQRELDIEILTYPAELMPVNPFDGAPQRFARLAVDLTQHPLKTVKDYENWQLRIDDNVRWTRQAIANMREGMRRGYTSPRILAERMLPLFDAMGNDAPDNVFYGPGRMLPETIGEPERTRLSTNLAGAVKGRLLPAYRELHDFIQSEYLARARVSIALSALPLGSSWYSSLIRRTAGTRATPNEIHAVGLAEVERLRARLLAVPAGPPPAAQNELLNAYQELKVRTLAAMPTLFSAAPPSDFEIRVFVPVGEAAAALAYQRAAPETGTSAILYVNAGNGTRPANVETAGFLLEAIPGRHYQWALQQQRTDLPRFRRFGSEPAFAEGWALYAATLGEELGVFRDDEAKRGSLLAQLKCAAALVVDTGIHAKNWTRAQAAGYLRTQLSAEETEADSMADRFVASPGNALACKMGELKFQALRSRAIETLGPRFDIREFHSEILKDGAMPLDILEAKMNVWMGARR
jgi:uncharacterized protein (DUF885 family)